MTDFSSNLIYGKNKLDRIVSIEPENNVAVIYRELEDGTIDAVEVPNRYWILSNKPHSDKWVKLDGSQHYCWAKQYLTSKDLYTDKKTLKMRNADFYSVSNAAEALMIRDGYTLFKGLRYNQVSILSWDIETTGLTHDKDSKVLLISNTFRAADGSIQRRLFCYDDYDNCYDMIRAWANWVCYVDPSIVIGHNLLCYDLPYIQYCFNRHAPKNTDGLVEEQIYLGRDGRALAFAKYTSKFRIDGSRSLEYTKPHIYGRQIVDTMFLAYRYDAVEKKYESYGLKPIIKQEKLEKVDRVFYDAGQIRFKYTDPVEWAKIKAYAEDDADDALALYDLMAAPTFYLTQSIPKPFQMMTESATGSQINALLVRAYLQDRRAVAKKTHIVGKNDESYDPDVDGVEGGISFAVPGIYRNVFKVDIKSCYPSQVLRFKLYNAEKDPEAYYYKLVEFFTLQRFEYKKQMQATGDVYWKNLDAMAKIFINSAYGVVNTSGLNYNSPDIADKITAESRAVIDMALVWASSVGYHYWNTKFYDGVGEKDKDRTYLSIPDYVAPTQGYCYTITPTDTDSISFCDSEGKEFTPEHRKKLLTELNSISPDKILWEDDGYYKKCIALKAKNYVLYDPTNTKKPVTIKGSSLKATTKSPAMKEMIKKIIDIILYTDDQTEMYAKLQEMYKGYMLEIHDMKDIKRWASRKTYTATVDEGEETTAEKLRAALKGTDYRQGDRFYTYFRPDESLALVEHYAGDEDKSRLYENLYDTIKGFSTILPVKDLFINYSLKRNAKYLPGWVEPVYLPKKPVPRKKKTEEAVV